jgi:Holliday junction resolvasome RuvABC DNA-binding subunit
VTTRPTDARVADAALALESLGYKPTAAQRAVVAAAEKLGPQTTVEELVRAALRSG